MKLLRFTFFATAILLFCSVSFLYASKVEVRPQDGLNNAIDFANANPGAADTLMLVTDGSSGVYELMAATIEVPMVIMAAPGLSSPPLIKAASGLEVQELIRIKNDLTVVGVTIDGQSQAGDYGKIRYMFKINNPPDTNPPSLEPSLVVMNCHIKNIYQEGDPAISENGNFFDISTNSYAKKVHFENTTLENSGDEAIRSINAHKSPVHPNGTAIGELTVRNCTFININGSSIKIESDDDSTSFDGNVLIENVTFYKCLRRVIWERDIENSIYRNLIIANSKTGNDTFGGTEVLMSLQRRGSVVANVDTFNVLKTTPADTVTLGGRAFVTTGGDWSHSTDTGDIYWETMYGFDPQFADPENGDFTLLAGSRAYGKAHDGGALGDRRWATNPPSPTTVQVRVADGLNAAIDFANANPGAADTLMLVTDGNAGVYDLTPTTIEVPMVIKAAPGLASPPVIKAASGVEVQELIRVKDDLTVIGVTIDGQSQAGDYGKIRYMFKINNNPTTNPPNLQPRLVVKDCHLKNIYQEGDPAISENGNFFDISSTSYAGMLHFENTTLENSGDEAIRSINTHKDPVHPNGNSFRALVVRNCTFNNINGSAIKIEGDADSLRADAPVLIENATFYKCLRRVIWERDLEYSIYRNLIIAGSKTGNDTFGGTEVLISFQRRGSVVAYVDTFYVLKSTPEDTVTLGPEAFVTTGGDWSHSSDVGEVNSASIYGLDPMFVDAPNGDFTLAAGSPLYTLAHDGGALGDRRWAKFPTGVDDRPGSVPAAFALEQNYPNPFNPSTKIRFMLDKPAQVKLQVFDLSGRLVATLVDGQKLAGQYEVEWRATNFASGAYFFRLQAADQTSIKKLMLLK